ncbi:MAG: c-type cytochrome biogenesis protein CcsB [Candidatus Binatia bacterium]|nr:MAG: c-type cytochrome biogenesis protein CcsB [Candidatus Binatia bacterium]
MSIALLLMTFGVYLSGTAAFLIHVVSGSEWSRRLGHGSLLLAVCTHAGALASRVGAFGYEALGPLPEQLSLVALFAVAVYLLVSVRVALAAVGAVLAPLAALATGSAYFFETGGPVASASRQGIWLPAHIGPTLLGYGVFALSFCLSLAYLLQERQIKRNARSGVFRRLPPLETLDQWNYRFVAWGFVFFTVGILTGAWLARQTWGSLWSWDPVQAWAWVVWIFYAGLLHLRSVGWRGKRAAQLVVWSFLLLLVSFIGVSMFFPGRHGVQTSWTLNS